MEEGFNKLKLEDELFQIQQGKAYAQLPLTLEYLEILKKFVGIIEDILEKN